MDYRHPGFSGYNMTITEAPDWARGFNLDFLRSVTSIFHEAHKPHVYGAFGLVKERDVANSMITKDFWCNDSAAALGHKLERGSTQHDFSGREILIPAGSYFIKAFAARNPLAAAAMVSSFKHNHKTFVVEIFEEDRIAKQAMLVSGLCYIGSKITAAGEVKGLYISGNRPQYHTPVIQNLSLACLNEQLVKPTRMGLVREELEAYDKYAQHYSSYNKRKSWSAFSLRGFRPDDPGFIIKPAEMARSWKEEHVGWETWECKDTSVSKKFPSTWRLLKNIPCKDFERVRFMRLAEKQGELSRHADITDRAAGPGIGQIARLHIPIFTNDKVRFLSWNERGEKIEHHLAKGSLWYLDTRKPHSVLNEGTSVRIHLVADVVCNEATQQLLLGRESG